MSVLVTLKLFCLEGVEVFLIDVSVSATQENRGMRSHTNKIINRCGEEEQRVERGGVERNQIVATTLTFTQFILFVC